MKGLGATLRQRVVARLPRRLKDAVLQAQDRAYVDFYGLRRALPFGSWGRMSREDSEVFRPVLGTWLPEAGKPARLVRWLMTEWCNYNCPYCDQSPHDRRSASTRGFTVHASDNRPAELWEDAFRRHFSDTRLSVVITGGEPFLDRPFITRMLKFLCAFKSTETLRVDTNASWNPDAFRDLDTSKIILMCTWHPSQIGANKFLANLSRLLERGFRIGIINYVMSGEQKERQSYLEHRRMAADMGVVLNPNPELRDGFHHTEDELALLREELPPADYRYKATQAAPTGKKCLFPTIGYQLDYRGIISVGCVHKACGSLFAERLPNGPAGPIPCPLSRCRCLDMYSFLGEVNRNITLDPLQVYSEQLKALRARQGTA